MPNSNSIDAPSCELRFVEEKGNLLPTLEIPSSADFLLEDLNLTFTVEDAPDDWSRRIVEAYETASQLPESQQSGFSFKKLYDRNTVTSDQKSNCRRIRPTFEPRNFGNLSKVNKNRSIQIVAVLSNDDGEELARSQSSVIKLSEENLFEASYRIDCDPKRWRILLKFNEKLGKNSEITPMYVTVDAVAKSNGKPRVDLAYEKSDLEELSRRLKLDSLKEQFEELERTVAASKFIEDSNAASKGGSKGGSTRRWKCAIERFTFEFTPSEIREIQREYFQAVLSPLF